MKDLLMLSVIILFLIAGAIGVLAIRYASLQYDSGMIAGEWKGRAETYQGIMDQQVRTMKALSK